MKKSAATSVRPSLLLLLQEVGVANLFVSPESRGAIAIPADAFRQIGERGSTSRRTRDASVTRDKGWREEKTSYSRCVALMSVRESLSSPAYCAVTV